MNEEVMDEADEEMNEEDLECVVSDDEGCL